MLFSFKHSLGKNMNEYSLFHSFIHLVQGYEDE
jgi:hypothetical protein